MVPCKTVYHHEKNIYEKHCQKLVVYIFLANDLMRNLTLLFLKGTTSAEQKQEKYNLTLSRAFFFWSLHIFYCAIAKQRQTFSSYLMTFPHYSLRTFQQKKKKTCRARLGQVINQSEFSDPTSEKFVITSELVFHGMISSLQALITVPVCVIFISQNSWHIRDLRSGQRGIISLQANGKIMRCVLLRVNEANPPNSFRIMTD